MTSSKDTGRARCDDEALNCFYYSALMSGIFSPKYRASAGPPCRSAAPHWEMALPRPCNNPPAQPAAATAAAPAREAEKWTLEVPRKRSAPWRADNAAPAAAAAVDEEEDSSATEQVSSSPPAAPLAKRARLFVAREPSIADVATADAAAVTAAAPPPPPPAAVTAAAAAAASPLTRITVPPRAVPVATPCFAVPSPHGAEPDFTSGGGMFKRVTSDAESLIVRIGEVKQRVCTSSWQCAHASLSCAAAAAAVLMAPRTGPNGCGVLAYKNFAHHRKTIACIMRAPQSPADAATAWAAAVAVYDDACARSGLGCRTTAPIPARHRKAAAAKKCNARAAAAAAAAAGEESM